MYLDHMALKGNMVFFHYICLAVVSCFYLYSTRPIETVFRYLLDGSTKSIIDLLVKQILIYLLLL